MLAGPFLFEYKELIIQSWRFNENNKELFESKI